VKAKLNPQPPYQVSGKEGNIVNSIITSFKLRPDAFATVLTFLIFIGQQDF
jgi:hypothetical protein